MKSPEEVQAAPECPSVVRTRWVRDHRWPLPTALVVLVLSSLIRLLPTEASKGPGYDEFLYRNFVVMMDHRDVGLTGYSKIADYHRADQQKPEEQAKLPPTRFSYIFSGWIMKRLLSGDAKPGILSPNAGRSGDPALVALCCVSWLASFTLVLLVGVAAWRMFGPWQGVGVMALAAVSPPLIHLGTGAFIDGFFALWATLCLWLLWENLQRPNRAGWLLSLGAALAIMVMTKENSFFVYVSLCALIASNRWLGFGTVTPRLVAVGILGPAVGVLALVALAGGVAEFIEIYQLLVTKAQNLPYAVWSGDGPWYRYLIELLTVDPLVFVLAVTGLFTLPREHRGYRFLLGFVVASYAIMCNVKYGMNLRYSVIWLLPFSAFAAAQLLLLARRAGRYSALVGFGLFAVLCAYDARQYKIFFVDHKIYELVPEGMLRAVDIIKDPPPGGGW
jgi:hypothetical protein